MISTKLDIGGNLLRLRVAKKHTQTALAKAIGIKQPNYCDIEAGRVIPTVPTLQKLAEFLEVPLTKLFEGEEEKSKVINTQNNVSGTNAISNDNSTNNFFENKDVVEKFQNALKDALASAMATEIEKLTK